MNISFIMLALLLVFALIGWGLWSRQRDMYIWQQSEILDLERKVKKLNDEISRLAAFEKFHDEWADAPEMKEELRELRSILQEMTSDRLSDSIRSEINKIGWGIVDDNGVDFSLKRQAAVERTRNLVRAGMAVKSTAGYSIAKETAACLLDAFDGYVRFYLLKKGESYAARVEMIKMAYYLVNLRVKDSLHLCITKEYLEAQLALVEIQEEISAYHSRKRAIDAETREIEASKDAESAKIRRQLAALRSKLEIAHANEKAMLEARIAELESQQRTISNAELTRKGTVYVISNVGSFGENVYKIGMTRRTDPQERVDELGSASVPFPFDVHAFIPTNDAPKLEAELHQIFKDKKINAEVIHGREFYRVRLDEIKQKVAALGYRRIEWVDNCSRIPKNKVSALSAETTVPRIPPRSLPKELPKEPPKEPLSARITDMRQLLSYLERNNLKWVDKRNVGGCLWVASTPETDSLLSSLCLDGKCFVKARTRHFQGDSGWFIA